jgi:hypothetical protein
MRVAIVGGGLSSMYAILACIDHGITPEVYAGSFDSPSGAVYLRWVPKRMEDVFKSHVIYINGYGTRDVYIQKQWGLDYPETYRSSFPESSVETVRGYDPSDLFAWISEKERINLNIIDHWMSWSDLDNLAQEYSVVFHSFPCGELKDSLSKYMTPIKIAIKKTESSNNSIDYNGKKDSIVVRRSCLFGYEHLELSGQISFKDDFMRAIFKDYTIKTINDIHPNILHLRNVEIPRKFGKLVPIGRLARMERHLLADSAYGLVAEEIECRS